MTNPRYFSRDKAIFPPFFPKFASLSPATIIRADGVCRIYPIRREIANVGWGARGHD
jgi:hypothetical protein